METTHGTSRYIPANISGRDKGSRDLRSQRPIIYSRGVLVSGWNNDRQQEPKDNDISTDRVRNLYISTYRGLPPTRYGQALERSTYQVMCEEPIKFKEDYRHRQVPAPIVNEGNVNKVVIDGPPRVIDKPKSGSFAVIPRHDGEQNKGYYFTTHVDHYRPNGPISERQEEACDYTNANKRIISQFTDCFNHRRPGLNHFLDESGVYSNQACKRVCPHYSFKAPPFRTNYE